MAPKKPVLDEASWRTIIEEATLNEETWKVKVIMMEAAGSDQDRIYLSKFEAFAAEERRFVIKNICKTETIFMVNQLGGEKKVRDDNLRVFEEGQAHLKEKKYIPSDIVALIIKHLILKMKEEYLFIRLQKLQVKEGLRRESATILDKTEVRGTVNVKPQEPTPPPPVPAKGKEKDLELEIPEPDEGKKYNTQLRIRGEEWRDKVYVDDYPTDGPNLYVAVTGFVDPNLPRCLIKIGIPLAAIVQIRIDPSTTKVPSTLLRATKRGQSQTEILTEISFKFWEELQNLRIDKTVADDLKHTAFVVFSPPYWNSESLSGNADKIYDELCYLMYDVQDLTRQHSHYLENMKLINIPDDAVDKRYHDYFCKIIHDLPLECLTMYTVLDTILHIVCKQQDIDNVTSGTSLSAAVSKHPLKPTDDETEKLQKAQTLVKDVFNTLCITDANRKAYRLTYGEEYETHRDPIIINYGNLAKYKTFHLGNINLDNIVHSSLLNMPIHNLWNNQDRPRGELEAKNNFHVNILLSCFEREDVETAELNRLIHILGCRKLYNNRSSLKKVHLEPSTISYFKKIYLKRSILAEPLLKRSSVSLNFNTTPSFPSMTKSQNLSKETSGDDSEIHRTKFLFDCPDISELVSAAEILSGKPSDNLIDDFEYFEDFEGISAFQVMLEAFNRFNCMDYKYCEVTDCFLLMFFNSHDKEGIAREEWRCHLSTPLCLQDFFDFVLEEQYDWIQNEEKNYDEHFVLNKQPMSQNVTEALFKKSCVDDSDLGLELLMEGSLKHQETMNLEEENGDQSTETKVTSKQTMISPSSGAADVSLKSSKKLPTSKSRKNFGIEHESVSIAIPKKPFSGYNLGDRRVEVFGKDATFFSKDGTCVSSLYTLIIPINVEYIQMKVIPGNSCNEFWLNRALGDSVLPEIVDMCESFRITCKDQVLINIKKQSYQVPILIVIPLESTKKEHFKSPSGALPTVPIQQTFETKTYYSLFVTWPNGLITESVHEDNSPAISHIKQYYTNRLPGIVEDMRCITLNGEVIIFNTSGVIEVLNPDGSYIKITKCKKQKIYPEFEEKESEASSDKSKKNPKGKSKEKNSKSSSKTSKVMMDVIEDIPFEYELVIDEYETVATSGLRQMWVKDTPFFLENLLIRTGTDFCQGEIFSRRMDGTHILLNKEGIQIVTFPNKTRIITRYIVEDENFFPEWTDEERTLLEMLDLDTIDTDTTKSKSSLSQRSNLPSTVSSVSKKIGEEERDKKKDRSNGYVSVKLIYSIEHSNFTTVTVNKVDQKISIDSPNNTTVEVDVSNSYNIILDKLTSAQFNGENLHINYEACLDCRSCTTCDIKVRSNESSSITNVNQIWLKMKDSYSKRIIVNEEGSISLAEESSSEEMEDNVEDLGNANDSVDNITEVSVPKTDSSVISHGKCRQMYLAKTMRFFILRRDLTCSELVHQALLEQYKMDCRWQPWYSINHCDTFGDHRSLLSILTPVHLTETEKWLMESKVANNPKYMTYKDLKKDCGKGFYHWMRPYARFEPKPIKPENELLPRLPRAYMLRTLEHQWKESEREEFKGARELLNAILKYRSLIEADMETLLQIPVMDLRQDDEKRTDEIIQALAHKVYEDLKAKLEADVQSHAKADITTRKPQTPSSQEEMSLEGEMSEEYWDNINLRCLEEEREVHVKKAESGEEISPNLKRYWRRRAEEYKEEQFYQHLLREGSVPPYFQNVLGGSIWWNINHAAAEAITKAERRKMKCVCADESPSEETPQPFI